MASINYLILAVLIVTPFVENAPSTKKISSEDELHTRLVFVDNNDNAVSSNSHPMSGSITPNFRKLNDEIPITVTRSKPVLVTAPAYIEDQGKTIMVDERQNWGLIAEESADLPEDDSYYSRPVSIPRNINTRINVPEKKTKVVKPEPVNLVPKPSTCDIAIISCCGVRSRSNECFKSRNCYSITEQMLSQVCSEAFINKTIAAVSKYYRG